MIASTRPLRLLFILAVPLCLIGPALAAEPTAHAPQFDNRDQWPDWVTKTDFHGQPWAPARILIWKHVGENTRGLVYGDPAHWRLPDGTQPDTGPDANTDVVLPAGQYHMAGAQAGGFHCRHLTIGAGVSAFLRSIHVHGNVWVAKGVKRLPQLLPKGDANVFWRSDEPDVLQAANKILINKPADRSIEFLGRWQTGDELNLFSGRMLIGPDSTFMPGDRSIQRVYDDAQLVLLSGSTFHKRGNQYHQHDIIVRGRLLAGTPERPLTRDAKLGLSMKSQGMGYRNPSRGSKTDCGLVIAPSGTLAVHSASPEEARLVLFWHRQPAQSFKISHDKDKIAALPQGISMALLGNLALDGVEFNDVLRGGIILPEGFDHKRSKHLYFGTHNLGSPEQLFATYDGSLDMDMKHNDQTRDLIGEDQQE